MKQILALIGLCALFGCAAIQPGADPLIVRAEQAEQIADSTFSLFLHLEYENRERIQSVPQIHSYAEWLREPQPVHGTNMPRAVALVFSLNDVKAAYRANAANSNLLVTATSTLTEALKQAADWTATINSTK